MLTCDMCGATVFLKYLGDGETDGGFTKWRKYEDAEGWRSFHFGKVSLANVCPKCSERINEELAKLLT